MTMAESASLSQACVRAARISAEAPLTTRITVICCPSCEQRQNPKRNTVRTEFLRLTALDGGADYIVTEDARDLLSLKVIKVRGFPPIQAVDASSFVMLPPMPQHRSGRSIACSAFPSGRFQ